MGERLYNVLFLCTHNSACSIMAEALLNDMGRGGFRAFSAGSTPGSAPNRFALETLAHLHLQRMDFAARDGTTSQWMAPRSWISLSQCATTRPGKICPVWPGQPITAHWGVEDPSLFQGSDDEKRHKFAQVAGILKRRIELLTNLPITRLKRLALQKRVLDIGHA